MGSYHSDQKSLSSYATAHSNCPFAVKLEREGPRRQAVTNTRRKQARVTYVKNGRTTVSAYGITPCRRRQRYYIHRRTRTITWLAIRYYWRRRLAMRKTHNKKQHECDHEGRRRLESQVFHSDLKGFELLFCQTVLTSKKFQGGINSIFI